MATSSTSYKAPVLLSIGKEEHFNSSSPKSWMKLMKILFAHLKDSSAQLRIMLVLCAAEDGQKLTQDWIEEQTSLVQSSYMRARQALETLGWITIDAYSSITVNYDKIYENEPEEEKVMYNPNKIEDSFKMCRSYCDTFKVLQKRDATLALTFMNAIIDYGLDRKKPDKDDPIWMNGIAAIFSQIDGSFQKELAAWRQVEE